MTNERVSSTIPRKLNLKLARAAKELGISKSALITACIESSIHDYTEQVKSIASALGVPCTIQHIKQRIAELDQSVESLTAQRDEFETKLNHEMDAYNKCYEISESRKQEIAYLKTVNKTLMQRNWWQRLLNKSITIEGVSDD